MTTLDAPIALEPMSAARVRNAYLTEARYSFVRFLRQPAFWIPTLFFPTAFYLLVGFIFGAFKAKNPDVPMYLYCAFVTMAAMTPGMFSFGIGLAMEREQGLYTFKRALPMPKFAALFGNVAMAMLSTVLAAIPLTAVAAALGLLKVDVTQALGIVAVAALGSVPFCAMGLLIGAFTSGRAAPAIVNIIYIVLMYFSGLFMPLPEGISFIVIGSPAFYLHQLTLEIAAVPNFILGTALNHVAVLVGVTLLCLGLSARRLERVG